MAYDELDHMSDVVQQQTNVVDGVLLMHTVLKRSRRLLHLVVGSLALMVVTLIVAVVLNRDATFSSCQRIQRIDSALVSSKQQAYTALTQPGPTMIFYNAHPQALKVKQAELLQQERDFAPGKC